MVDLQSQPFDAIKYKVSHKVFFVGMNVCTTIEPVCTWSFVQPHSKQDVKHTVHLRASSLWTAFDRILAPLESGFHLIATSSLL